MSDAKSTIDRPAPAIQLERVSVRFGAATDALAHASVSIPAGKITALVGPSGCGKSTLLRVVAGLQSTTDGRLRFQPDTFMRSGGNLGYVFQDAALVPWRSALQNVTLPLELVGRTGASERQARAEEMLRRVALPPETHTRRPEALSGGMRMRVSVARAFVTQPSLLLMDEPFAALDEMLRLHLCRLTLALWEEQQPTILFVTHNISEAILMSHRIAIMGPGTILSTLPNAVGWPRTSEVQESDAFRQLYRTILDGLETEYATA